MYIVSGLKNNMMRKGQLLQKGYWIYMEVNHYVIMDKFPSNQLIAGIHMRSNKIFPLTLKLTKKKNTTLVVGKGKTVQLDTVFTTKSVCSSWRKYCTRYQERGQFELRDNFWPWHFRFGHLNFGDLKLLHTKDMVKGFPLIEKRERICEGCIFGKKHRESIPIGKCYREKVPLEIVHAYICGPMQTPSIEGSTYFLTFIDNFSRKTWIYLLKHKSDALGFF